MTTINSCKNHKLMQNVNEIKLTKLECAFFSHWPKKSKKYRERRFHRDLNSDRWIQVQSANHLSSQ